MKLPAHVALCSLLAACPVHAVTGLDLPPVSGFVPNVGQAPPEVLYYAAAPRGAIYLTREAVVLDTWESDGGPVPGRRDPARFEEPLVRRRGRATWYRFDSATAAPGARAEAPLGPRLHLFLGGDAAGGRTGIPIFARVVYPELWPGCDLVCAMERGELRLSVNAAPGAMAAAARFLRDPGEGAPALPVTPAEVSAELGRGAGPGAFDDPGTLRWSTFLGATSEEIGWAVAVAADGEPVVTGLTISTFFPTTPGAYDRTYAGSGDVFVARLSADGSALRWSTFLGGSSPGFDYGYAVALDAGGHPVVTGYTFSPDFPITPGAWEPSHHGNADVFVAKLDAAGDSLHWSTFLGGDSHDIGYTLGLDAGGNVVVAGRTLSLDFLATPGAYDLLPGGEEDGFVAKLSAGGNTLLWMTLLGGDLYDGVEALALGADGSPFLCGYTASSDFPAGSAQGLYDAFAARLSPGGSALLWSRLAGGSAHEYGTCIALDSAGDAVIAGATGSPDFPVTPGAWDESYNGDDDVFVAKLRGTDGAAQWATFAGGSTFVYEIGMGLALDAADRPIVAGATPSADFPVTATGFDTGHNGASDVFLLALGADGSSLEWGTFLGGPEDDYAFALARAPGGEVVLTGASGAGFPVTPGAFDTGYNGDLSDVFVARLAIPGAATGVALAPRGTSLALRVVPNPAPAAAEVRFELARACVPAIEVFDAAGRRRATLPARAMGPGTNAVRWEGLDDEGRGLPAGVYRVRLTAEGRRETRSVVLLR